jgi:hypothetical protein
MKCAMNKKNKNNLIEIPESQILEEWPTRERWAWETRKMAQP